MSFIKFWNAIFLLEIKFGECLWTIGGAGLPNKNMFFNAFIHSFEFCNVAYTLVADFYSVHICYFSQVFSRYCLPLVLLWRNSPCVCSLMFLSIMYQVSLHCITVSLEFCLLKYNHTLPCHTLLIIFLCELPCWFRIFSSGYKARESAMYGSWTGENSRLWFGQRDPFSPSLYRLCVHKMVREPSLSFHGDINVANQ